MTDKTCETFAGIGPDAELAIDRATMADRQGVERPVVRLLVDGTPIPAVPRDVFLASPHIAVHDLWPPHKGSSRR